MLGVPIHRILRYIKWQVRSICIAETYKLTLLKLLMKYMIFTYLPINGQTFDLICHNNYQLNLWAISREIWQRILAFVNRISADKPVFRADCLFSVTVSYDCLDLHTVDGNNGNSGQAVTSFRDSHTAKLSRRNPKSARRCKQELRCARQYYG